MPVRCQFDALLGGACLLGKATPNFQRLRLSVLASAPETLLVLALSGEGRWKRNRPLRCRGEGGNRRDRHAIFPSLSSRGINVPPEFAPFPAALQVGCQASSGRFPSATLDESERKRLFSCWANCTEWMKRVSRPVSTYPLNLLDKAAPPSRWAALTPSQTRRGGTRPNGYGVGRRFWPPSTTRGGAGGEG